MGRSGRVTSRVCATLELRFHGRSSSSSSSMALTLLPSPSSSSISACTALCKGASCCNTLSPCVDTTGEQAPVVSEKSQQLVWPQNVFQLISQHVVEVLASQSSSSAGEGNEAGKLKRNCPGNEQQESLEKQRRAIAGGIEVDLRAQSPLPEDWEQLLDLKTGELYYFHRGSCKRAKTDPRELARQADDAVRALVLKAQARFTPKDHSLRHGTAAALDVATRADVIASSEMDSGSLEASSSHGSPREVESANSQEKWKKKCGEDPKDTRSVQTGMVALGCHRCSMFVMLFLSSPSCPSCGDPLQSDHDRDG